MRDWIHRNSVLISFVSVLVIAVLLISRLGSSPREHNSDLISDECWYYDVVTGDYVKDKISKVPPLVSDKGNELVRVVFFSCGACSEAERFPGYYLKHTAALKAKAEAQAAESSAMMLHGERLEGRMFSLDGKTWVAAPDAVAAGVFDHHRHTCDGRGSLKMCR